MLTGDNAVFLQHRRLLGFLFLSVSIAREEELVFALARKSLVRYSFPFKIPLTENPNIALMIKNPMNSS